MKYLFFDTETTGFPPKARLVSIAWQIWDDINLIEKENFIIRPKGFTIPFHAERVHGISTEYAQLNGYDLKLIINLFDKKIRTVDALIAHNYKFDHKIIAGEYRRLSIPEINFRNKIIFDTMTTSTNYVKLPAKKGRKKYKYPKLEELYKYLFGKNFKNAHSADADVEATVKCFFELKKIGII